MPAQAMTELVLELLNLLVSLLELKLRFEKFLLRAGRLTNQVLYARLGLLLHMAQ